MVVSNQWDILVIEPQVVIQQRLKSLIEEARRQSLFTLSPFLQREIQVFGLPPGVHPLQYIELHTPQLVILDPFHVAYPCDLNGFQLCETLKQNPKTDGTPLFLCKSDAQNIDAFRLKSLSTGANDFIVLSEAPSSNETQKVWAKLQFALNYESRMREAQALSQQLNQLNEEVTRRNNQIEKDLYTTRQLQQSLLPEPLANDGNDEAMDYVDPMMEFRPSKGHFKNDSIRVTGLYLPCDALGGDLYDVMVFKDQDNALGITMADVSGHGVPAGFITAIFKAAFYRLTHTYKAPSEVLFHLNNELANIITTGDYITSIFLTIDPSGRQVLYSGAGHPYPIHYHHATGTLSRLTENGPPLVWFPDMDYPQAEISLLPGDKLLLFTDGVSEMKNEARQLYTEEALEQLFLSQIHQSANLLMDKMAYALSDYTEGHPLEDDVSMVLIEAL